MLDQNQQKCGICLRDVRKQRNLTLEQVAIVPERPQLKPRSSAPESYCSPGQRV